jgi:hypothetical protein
MPRQSKNRPIALATLAALPAVFVCYAIFTCAVDLPYGDEWEIAPFLMKKAQGALTLSDLFAPINEYRQFFPNLIIVHLGSLTRWDVRYEMLLSFLLACVVSHNVYRLGVRTLAHAGERRPWAFLLSNLIIFSPVQYENWLMGQQLIFFVPAACVTTCLLVCVSCAALWKKLLVCASLSAVSTFSSANGLLCWVVTLPVLAGAETWGAFARRKWPTTVWAFGFALCAALYFYDFRRGDHLPPTSESLLKPWLSAAYILSLLGSPLTGHSRYLTPVAALVGLALAALFVRAWLSYLKAEPGTGLRPRMLCWLMLGTYSVMTAALVTYGRAGAGLHRALGSRYTTFSLYLIVALIHLAVIARGESRGRRPEAGRRPALAGWRAAITALLVLHLLASAVSVRQMIWLRTRLLQAKACVLLINLVGGGCLPQEFAPNPELLPERVNAVDRLGFLRPGLIESRFVQDFAGAAEPRPAYGSFDRLTRENGSYVASGIAALPHRGEPADAVLLAYKDGGGRYVLFALAEMDYKGDILKRLRQRAASDLYSWRHSFPPDALPAGAGELSAWAFDASSGRAFRLGAAHAVRGALPEVIR